MPFAVSQILERKPPLETVGSDTTAGEAVRRMRAKDYTQLAVVDNHRLVGLVSHESILEAIARFGCRIEQLLVRDATTKATTIPPDGDLSDLLEALAQSSAIIVVDREGRIHGIVTDYDTTAWFREDIEDRLNWADVELGLKQLVADSFGGQLQSGEAKAAIKKVTQRDNRATFLKALSECVDTFDQKRALAAYDSHFATEREFERLTFHDYCQLLTDAGRWGDHFRASFGDKREQISGLLRRVGEARNQLAHLRSVSDEQRDELEFCAKWIARVLSAHAAKGERGQTPSVADMVNSAQGSGGPNLADEVAGGIQRPRGDDAPPQYPEDEDTTIGSSTYSPITAELRQKPSELKQISYSFEAVEQLLRTTLPPSARRHRAWWANDTTSHVQAQAWLGAGWRAVVNLGSETVTFTRIEGREARYIEFFTALLAQIRVAGRVPVTYSAAQGRSWAWIAAFRTDAMPAGWLAASFTARDQFRIEAYLDADDSAVTKRLFDSLYARRLQVENNVGFLLAWERLDRKRASRIARYWPGRISDSAPQLAKLREEAADAAARLYQAISAELSDAK